MDDAMPNRGKRRERRKRRLNLRGTAGEMARRPRGFATKRKDVAVKERPFEAARSGIDGENGAHGVAPTRAG